MDGTHKNLLFILAFIISTIVLGGCISKKEQADVHLNISDVDRIYVTNGENGEIMEITSESDILKVNEYMNNITYKYKIAGPWGGFSYAISFLNGDILIKEYVFSEKIVSIDGVNYTPHNNNKETMEELFISLKDSTFESDKD